MPTNNRDRSLQKSTTLNPKKDQNGSKNDKIDKNLNKNQKTKNVVDVRRTLLKNTIDGSISQFCLAILTQKSEVLQSKVCCACNCLVFLQSFLYQFLVQALPLLPQLLIPVLISIELAGILLTALPFCAITNFISAYRLISRILRFLMLEGFLVICAVISFQVGGKKLPVNTSLQECAIVFIIFGVAVQYFIFGAEMILMVKRLITKHLKKKSLKKDGEVKDGAIKQKMVVGRQNAGIIVYCDPRDDRGDLAELGRKQDPEKVNRPRERFLHRKKISLTSKQFNQKEKEEKISTKNH